MMIPWNKLPRRLQESVLIMVILSSSTAVGSGCAPVVCDPAPPPPTTRLPTSNPPFTLTPSPTDTPTVPPTGTPTSPRPEFTPVICDPMPPPSVIAPTRTATPTLGPIICDPAPPPSIVRPTIRFQPRTLLVVTDNSLPGAAIQGQVLDSEGKPFAGVQVTAKLNTFQAFAGTDAQGRYLIVLPEAGDYIVFVGDDQADGVHLRVKQADRATIDWASTQPHSQRLLPLAEIRSVDILTAGERTFKVDTPWEGARLRWTVSGGQLQVSGGQATWEPPTEPGRYLLQVVADWGPYGVAVNSRVIVVEQDGSIKPL